MRRTGRRRLEGFVGCLALATAVSFGFSASAATGASACADYATLSIEGLASGAQVVQGLEDATLVNAVDAAGPSAQALVNSITGSSGRAGSPFSSTVADNAGQAHASPNDVPFFAVSSYPVRPEASQKSPAFTLQATSGQYVSTAAAEVAGRSTPTGAAGSARTSATAECTDDGSLHAIADSVTDGIAIANVLTIGSVRSHAEVTISPSGERKVDATTKFEGVAVLGQPIAISEEGLIIGPTVAPMPANPLATALERAGITARYLDAVKDPSGGTGIAPGVELTVTYTVPGVGSGPLSTSFTFGQAYARASRTTAPAVVVSVPAPPVISAPVAASPLIQSPPTTPALAETAAPVAAGARLVNASTTRIADWSIAAAYYALALGMVLSIGVRAGYRRLLVRFRWT